MAQKRPKLLHVGKRPLLAGSRVLDYTSEAACALAIDANDVAPRLTHRPSPGSTCEQLRIANVENRLLIEIPPQLARRESNIRWDSAEGNTPKVTESVCRSRR